MSGPDEEAGADPELERALDRALAENFLDEAHREDVRALLDLPRERWPPCCGSFCDPCNLALHRAAERVRRLLLSARR